MGITCSYNCAIFWVMYECSYFRTSYADVNGKQFIHRVFGEEVKGKGKSIPLQAWTVPEGSRRFSSQISRHSAHESGKFVTPKYRPPLHPGNIPGTHFCYRLSQPSVAGRIMLRKKSNDTIGNRTRDLPACSAVPQPTAPTRVGDKVVKTIWSMREWQM
jgi:hypothetical protein